MTGHLNRFACQAESKLAEVDRRTQQIQTTLLLLEAKLASIPELEAVKLEEEPPKSDVTTQNQSEPAQSAPVAGTEAAEQSTEVPPEEPAPETAPGSLEMVLSAQISTSCVYVTLSTYLYFIL